MRYLVLLALALAAPALADGPTVRAIGSAARETLPDTVRAVTHVFEQGANLEAAMAAAAQRAAVMEKGLKALSPAKLTLSPPRVATQSAAANQKLQRAIKRLKQIKTGGTDEQVMVSIVVTGEWPLTDKDPAASVGASQELSRKIASVARSAHTTEGEGEKEDEDGDGSDSSSMFSSEMASRMGGAAKPGTVSLTYVKKVPRELVDELAGEAFKNAKDAAQRNAALAGHEIGALQTLASAAQGGPEENEGMTSYYAAMRTSGAGMASTLPGWEITATNFAPLKVRVDVDTTWAMKPK